MGVLNRWRCIKIITVIVGLSYVGYLNYHTIGDIKLSVAKAKNISRYEYIHDINSKVYVDKTGWYKEKEILKRTSN